MNPSYQPTQKDIARKAGVTQATVSLALSHHPSISEETSTRIQGIAQEMGYHPDPYLAGLSAYRKKMKPMQIRATLAWVSNYPHGYNWRIAPSFRNYYEGACDRAIELGYQVEEHSLCENGMNSDRMAKILRARNIYGLLLAPQPNAGMRLDFSFDDFSAVAFGYTLISPQFHVVTTHHFRAVEIVFRELIALGYQRPGLALIRDDDKRVNRLWSASFLSEQCNLPASERVPLFVNPQQDRTIFLEWFRQYRPDVVIALQEDIYHWLAEAGIEVPEETGFVLLSVPDGCLFYSGIWENPRLIGERAVEQLIELIHRSERGKPEVPGYLLMEGSWVEGKTVRNKAIVL